MNTDGLELFLSKVSSIVYGLIIVTNASISSVVYLQTKNLWLCFITFLVLSIVGFAVFRLYTNSLIIDLRASFVSPFIEELNEHIQSTFILLDLIVDGKMLPTTRDDLIYCILLEEGHKDVFIKLLEQPHFQHILKALHESLDRSIQNIRGSILALEVKFLLGKLQTIKEQLPPLK